MSILKKTGFKDLELENSSLAVDFFKAVLSDKNHQELKEKFNEDFFRFFFEHTKEISKTAIAPLSHAHYACILVFQDTQSGEFFVHSGSNIDPGKKENFKIPKYRNCAEKQASLSALEIDSAENNELKILFLFRLDSRIKFLNAQKLLPCSDCFNKYVPDLKNNNGVMVLVCEEMDSKDFLLDSKEARELIFERHRYVFLSGDELSNLNLEPELGANQS